ncbi:MAG: hypothetical protein AAF471_04570 [Myxococcota bacterium]
MDKKQPEQKRCSIMNDEHQVGVTGQNFPVEVSAKHCMWFAFANGNLQGPMGESGPAYKPNHVVVPAGSTVDVELEDFTQLWSHHPERESGAEGFDDTRDLENPAYKNAAYNSQNIVGINTNLNRLVGMFAKDVADPHLHVTEIIDLNFAQATSTTQRLFSPGESSLFFLAFHDGEEWTNNEGFIDVIVKLNQ